MDRHPAGNDSFGGYLALPSAAKAPAVIIIQEIFGVNAHIRAVADQYASDGFASRSRRTCSGARSRASN